MNTNKNCWLIKMVIAVVAIIVSITTPNKVLAQMMVTSPVFNDYIPPTVQVPYETFLEGRQAVAGWLNAQVDNVLVTFRGNSVSPDHRADQYLDRQKLTDLGYVHDGSFTELSEAIKKIPFRGKIVKKGNYNYYNVYASVTCRDNNGRILLQGGGSFNLYTDKDGNLVTEDFPIWLWISGDILAKLPYIVSAASLIGEYGGESYLSSYNTEDGSLVRLNSSALGADQILKIAYETKEGPSLLAINLRTGIVSYGIEVIKYFTSVNSGDIRTLKDPVSIDAGDVKFYQNDGYIYGRFPLTEIVISEGQSFKDAFIIEVPVWGREKKISPSRVFLTSLLDGKRVEIPIYEGGQWFIVSLTPGIWHLEVLFDGVKDPDLDYNSRG